MSRYNYDQTLNIPGSVAKKIGKNLHLKQDHPIGIIKDLTNEYFGNLGNKHFEIFDSLEPLVTVEANFDSLLIPESHPARSKSDTYYFDQDHVLRTHTSAHQNEILSCGSTSFLVAGDVYRKDEIDATHYPVFHQMEGVWIDVDQTMSDLELINDLINVLKGLCGHLFPGCPVKVQNDYFPFTDPSFQIDVYHNGKWLEILGCGIIQRQIIKNCSTKNLRLVSDKNEFKKGWAFGLGLDRLAMILFEIPDIRMMWVESDKFTQQFKTKTITKFKPYSVLDTICKDVSFYIPSEQVVENPTSKIEDVEKYTDKKTNIVRVWVAENDMFDGIREFANKEYPDVVAKVEMFDQFYNQKLCKLSRAYRIYYSPPDPGMTDPGEYTGFVNKLHSEISKYICETLNLEFR